MGGHLRHVETCAFLRGFVSIKLNLLDLRHLRTLSISLLGLGIIIWTDFPLELLSPPPETIKHHAHRQARADAQREPINDSIRPAEDLRARPQLLQDHRAAGINIVVLKRGLPQGDDGREIRLLPCP